MSEDRLERMEAKLDQVITSCGDTAKATVENTASLREHMHRSDLLETAQAELKKAQEAIRAEVRPLIRAHYMWAGVGKVLAAAGTLAVIAEAAMQVLHR